MMEQMNWSITYMMFGSTLLGCLSGCVVDGPPRRVYVQPPVVELQGGVVMEDDYVYYPDYQVYYSSNRHQYLYQERGAWVTRSSPPRVSVSVFMGSPSVRLGFHDHPSLHHETISRQYPKHWAPPGHDRRP